MKLPEELEQFLNPIISMCKAQFPRKCSNCARDFADFREFVSATRPIGTPQCSQQTEDPLGLLSYVNCKCGSTVVLSCADEVAHARFKDALAAAAERTGQDKKKLLLALRDEVRQRMLGK